MTRRQFKPSLAGLIATAVVVAICARLGTWQLHRAEEKDQWQALVTERQASGNQDLEALLSLGDPAFFPVNLEAIPDNTHTILLDNRILDGLAGYHVLTPVQTTSGRWILLNRGWIARGASRDQLPAIAPLPSPVRIQGHLYQYSDKTFTLSDTELENGSWPWRVQKVDMRAIGQRLGVELPALEIRANPDAIIETESQLPRIWLEQPMPPERHRAYALQWFGLASAATLIFLAASLRRREDEPPELDA